MNDKSALSMKLSMKQIILVVMLLVIGASCTQLLSYTTKAEQMQLSSVNVPQISVELPKAVLEISEGNYQKVTSRGISQRNFEDKQVLVQDVSVVEQPAEEEVAIVEEPVQEEETYISIEEIEIYRDMDLTQRCGISKEDFKELMNNLESDTTNFFYDNSDTIYELCKEYEINEIFFCGLIAAESGWQIASSHRKSNNYVSMMSNGSLIKYSTPEEGLEAATKLLHNSYLTEGGSYYYGKTLSDVQTRYCPNSSTWVNLVYGCMNVIV